jgi:putative phosphoesterase
LQGWNYDLSTRRTHKPSETLKPALSKGRPHVVVFGHTHKAFFETIGGVLFFNPGYAGRPKHDTKRSVAIMHCDQGSIRQQFVEL